MFQTQNEKTHCDSDISATKTGTNVNVPPLARPDNARETYNCQG